eukprot:CAMPEP_0179233844 /NCGR_PEP_ID=MMETSP0797-20121207/12583_1 /TAXON_ID=47934 /ORGANISM="Dinophysis acuminata, Strain DAEP01" /LENGTH=348 /DNA_ID=CAMNT_0020941005 /DNA_START=1 /DNA_END=1046 /DNA_ORIENTATION=-
MGTGTREGPGAYVQPPSTKGGGQEPKGADGPVRDAWPPQAAERGAALPGSGTEADEGCEGVPPTVDGKAAEAERRRMSQWLGSVTFWSVLVGILGFIPAYAAFLVEGTWYLDAFKRYNLEDAAEAEHKWGGVWMAGVGIHAVTGLLWTLAAFHQSITGATGPPGGQRKALHRRVGYPAAVLGFFVVIQAIALQFLKPFNLANYIPILTNGALILLNLLAGIRYARLKRYAEHKLAMAWTCAWTGAPGGVRVAIYLFNISGGMPEAVARGDEELRHGVSRRAPRSRARPRRELRAATVELLGVQSQSLDDGPDRHHGRLPRNQGERRRDAVQPLTDAATGSVYIDNTPL